MSVLYHLTILPPRLPECEAISQEVNILQRYFGGSPVYVNPNQGLPIYIPRLLFGFHRLKELRRLEMGNHLHHLYNPDPFSFPYLRLLRRPVVYSLTGGVANSRINARFFASLAVVTVYDEESLKYLRAIGLENVVWIPPGIDTSRFSCVPLPLRSEMRLLVGSAPWTKAQFQSKGIDALLDAAKRLPRLHLIFLWRGVLADVMEEKVRRLGLEERVQVLNQQVDVNHILASVHAAVALAEKPAIIRSYPHSLMESLAAGKPVLVNRAIPMAGYVEKTGCGVVVEQVTSDAIMAAIDVLMSRYDDFQRTSQMVGSRDFSIQRVVEAWGETYERVRASR